MDMTPFLRINPCGYAGLEMVQTADLGGPDSVIEAGQALIEEFKTLLQANELVYASGLPAGLGSTND